MGKLLRALLILVASVIGGGLNSAVFLIALNATLPSTDWAYHPNPFRVLSDSFPTLLAILVGAAAGLLVSPVAGIFLWRKRLATSIPFVYALVLPSTAVMTRVTAWGGFPMS